MVKSFVSPSLYNYSISFPAGGVSHSLSWYRKGDRYPGSKLYARTWTPEDPRAPTPTVHSTSHHNHHGLHHQQQPQTQSSNTSHQSVMSGRHSSSSSHLNSSNGSLSDESITFGSLTESIGGTSSSVGSTVNGAVYGLQQTNGL